MFMEGKIEKKSNLVSCDESLYGLPHNAKLLFQNLLGLSNRLHGLIPVADAHIRHDNVGSACACLVEVMNCETPNVRYQYDAALRIVLWKNNGIKVTEESVEAARGVFNERLSNSVGINPDVLTYLGVLTPEHLKR
jgi:hypothetical protein